MKKVLIVIPSLEQGGGQKFVVDLAKRIDKEKFEVKILSYYKRNNTIFDEFVDEHNINIEYLDKKIGFDISLFPVLKRAVKAYDPDVIHTNLYSLIYLIPCFKKKQVKIHTFHTIAEKEASGIHKIMYKFAFKFIGVTPVGICDMVAHSIADVYNMDYNKIPIVYNGVDCERYKSNCKEQSENVNIISVGTIYHVKNYAFLVDCFSEACKIFPNIHLTLVGDGVLRKDIEKQADDLGIRDKITITGTVSDVENYLINSDIYAASSIFEGLPLSILEAMSSGLPIISTNVGGVSNIVCNNENGILVELNDKLAYIEALKRLIGDAELRKKYSECSKKLSKKYDLKYTVCGYENLYQGK